MQYAHELKPIAIEEVAKVAERCHCNRIFLHWTAGHYGQIYPDYHISIDFDGKIYFPNNCDDFDQYRPSTWRCNTGSIGIAVCGCYDAEANHGYDCDLGSEPVTQAQIETMAVLVAVICKHAGIDLTDVMTHEEIATEMDYGPGSGDPETRWDLWWLPDDAQHGKMMRGGDLIRAKAAWYLQYYPNL